MNSRGLHNFLSQIYKSPNIAQSFNRMFLELYKIKKAFLSPRLSSKDRRKYIAKLCFIVLSGYSVNFGLPQIRDLVSARKISEQRIGWMAAVIVCGSDPEQVQTLMHDIKRQILEPTSDFSICFALTTAASFGGAGVADAIGPIVAELAVAEKTSDPIRKRALLTLAALYRTSHQLPSIDRVTPKLAQLLNDTSFGVRISNASLIQAILQQQPAVVCDVFPVVLSSLHAFFVKKEHDKDCTMSDVPCPLLSCKLLQILRYKPEWSGPELEMLESIINAIIDLAPPIDRDYDRLVSFYTVFYEVAPMCELLKEETVERLLKVFLTYLQLARDDRSATYCHYVFLYAHEGIANVVRTRPHCAVFLNSLPDRLFPAVLKGSHVFDDERAVQLAYIVANNENGLETLSNFLEILPCAPLYLRASIAEKAAVLTQSYAVDHFWGVDKLLWLLSRPELADDDRIWRIALQYVSQRRDADVRKYLSDKLVMHLQESDRPTNPIMALAASVFAGSVDATTVSIMFRQLGFFFPGVWDSTKAVIVTTFMQFALQFKDVRPHVNRFFQGEVGSMVPEVSQRCREYLSLLSFSEPVLRAFLARSSCSVSDIEKFKQTRAEPGKDAQEEQLNGIGVVRGMGASIRLGVTVRPPRATALVTLDPSKNGALTKFEITSPAFLEFEIANQLPGEVFEGMTVEITVEFRAIHLFKDFPVLRVEIDDKAKVEMKIPISVARWMVDHDVDEIPDMDGTVPIDLVIPDGDVMIGVAQIVRRTFGLRPLELPGLGENVMFVSGLFRCVDMDVVVSMKFVYSEPDMDLRLFIDASAQQAIDILSKLARDAFC
jgi:hypothetical protein